MNDVEVFSFEFLAALSERARESPRKRQHHNVHRSHAEPCQRFFNAIEPQSYVRPHRQVVIPRTKLLIAVRGSFVLFLYGEEGGIDASIPFGVDEANIAVDVSPGRWNSVVARKSGSVLVETKAGPYDPEAPREVAPWSPEEGTEDAIAFVAMLHDVARRIENAR